jgi:hypothetical protein
MLFISTNSTCLCEESMPGVVQTGSTFSTSKSKLDESIAKIILSADSYNVDV